METEAPSILHRPFKEQEDPLGKMCSNLYTPLLWAFDYSAKINESKEIQLDHTGNRKFEMAENKKYDEESSVIEIIEILTGGLSILSTSCPYLAAELVNIRTIHEDGNSTNPVICPTDILMPYNYSIIPLRVRDLRSEKMKNVSHIRWSFIADLFNSKEPKKSPIVILSDAEKSDQNKHLKEKINDHISNLPSLSELKAMSFPVQSLPGEILLPLAGLPSSAIPSSREDSPTNVCRPAFVIQANFIDGNGLLLCIAGEHSVMDGSGMAAVLHLFHRCCSKCEFHELKDDISLCNMTKGAAVPLCPPNSCRKCTDRIRDNYEEDCKQENASDKSNVTSVILPPGEAIDHIGNNVSNDIHHICKIDWFTPGRELDLLTPTASNLNLELQPASWNIFHFSSEKLKCLKKLVVETLPLLAQLCPSPSPDTVPSEKFTLTVPFVSTNDVLTAFIWHSIMRIRFQRCEALTSGLSNKNSNVACSSTFSRAVDMRSLFGLPQDYPGNMSLHTYSSLQLEEIVGRNNRESQKTLLNSGSHYSTTDQLDVIGIARCAAILRHDLISQKELLITQMRSLLTWYQQKRRNGSQIFYPGATLRLSTTDLIMSSWASMPCYSFDFGLGIGLPLSVRRPLFDPVEGLLYLLPSNVIKSTETSPPGGTGAIDALLSLSVNDLERLRTDNVFTEYAKWIG